MTDSRHPVSAMKGYTMSKPELVTVLTKMRRDKQYRNVVNTDPDTALVRYDLSAEERDALVAVDPARLEALGIGTELAAEAVLGRDPLRIATSASTNTRGATGCG